MAPSDAIETTDFQGEPQKMPIGQIKSYDTFHRYPDLPFELRAPIRAFAIQAADRTDDSWGIWTEDSLSCSRLATVSKEWQGDVEEATFRKIRVDPFNDEEISEFEKHFTNIRKKYLTQIEIAVDDHPKTGFWGRSMGLLDISRFMEKTGRLFQRLNAWDFSSNGNKQHSIDVMFTTTCHRPPGFREGRYNATPMGTRCLWDRHGLRNVTANDIPTNVALWAIKSEFPSTLSMVTHLTFSPDCVPIDAAKRILEVMPNLESCSLETHFTCEVEEGWRDYTDFIHHLRTTAPSLRQLSLKCDNENIDPPQDDVPVSMVTFANALRQLSQSLDFLQFDIPRLNQAFLLPFSDNADADAAAAASHCTWPTLQTLVLSGYSELPISSLGPATLSPFGLLMAAAKATLAMPNLKDMAIFPPGDGYFFFEPGVIGLRGFSEDEDRKILAEYAHLVGSEVKLFKEDHSGALSFHHPLPPLRFFKPVKEGMDGS